ncbi:hypothetical protein BH11BAC2_BH11BAC2_20270 [soil metagenome]
MSKKDFLSQTFVAELKKLDPQTPALWGKMNVQQMIEHMSDSIRMANGKDQQNLYTSTDQLPVYRSFMLSEKPFRQNTKNALMGEEPLPLRHGSNSEALHELKTEIDDFIALFENQPGLVMMNPIFGELDFDQWLHLFDKHARHHLLQFGVSM